MTMQNVANAERSETVDLDQNTVFLRLLSIPGASWVQPTNQLVLNETLLNEQRLPRIVARVTDKFEKNLTLQAVNRSIVSTKKPN